MDAVKLKRLKTQVGRLFKENPEGSVIQFMVNDQVKGEYQIPHNHFVTLDSKQPVDWIKDCIFFEIKLKGIKNAKVCLTMKR